MSNLLNSNRIGIKNITDRLEHEIYTHIKQELNWQAKVILNNFREHLKTLEANMELGPLTIISILNRFLDEYEKEINESTTT